MVAITHHLIIYSIVASFNGRGNSSRIGFSVKRILHLATSGTTYFYQGLGLTCVVHFLQGWRGNGGDVGFQDIERSMGRSAVIGTFNGSDGYVSSSGIHVVSISYGVVGVKG